VSPSGGAAGPGMGEAADRFARTYAAYRYAVLFYLLLATLGVSPLLTGLGFSADLLQVLVALSLLLAVLDVPGPRWRRALVVLAAVVIALRIVPASAVGTQAPVSALVVGAGVGLLAAASAMRFALRGRVADAEHVYAALSAYLLAGQFFGVLYWAIAAAWPGSFADPAAAGSAAGLSLSSAMYFSFVTLATLGYGDVVPRSDMARGLAVLEAVGGQLFVAVTIARLVSARAQALDADADQSSKSSSRSLRGR
jgi:voltage-gated potassium channel